jgi:uncharacterized DUF497 family protein
MRVVWDPNKARANHLKHGIRFSDADGVLFDPLAITREDVTSMAERRFVTIGVDNVGRVVVVVYAPHGESLRLISARHATRKERQQYAEGIRF